MRWYDYLMCIWLADILSAGLINGSLILLMSGLFTYLSYEHLRRYKNS
jgi:hypothetical protein